MSKVADLAKTSTKASFNYLWGLVISTVISSVGAIFIANLLGSDAYGLYGIALTVPNLLMVFRDWGINSAMIRYTAQYRSENRASEMRSIFASGVVFELAIGLILALVSFLISGYLASDVYNRPEIAPLIQIASISILTSGLITAASSVFTGTEEMTYNSVMLICQSGIRTFLIIGLVFVGLGTSGAIIGYTLSTLVACFVGLAFIWVLYRRVPVSFSHNLAIREYTKEMLRYGLPISLFTILAGFLTQFYVMLLPFFSADNSLIGNYFVAVNFVVLIGFFSLPITTMLFPAFSKLDIKKDHVELKSAFQFSVKYSALIVVPVSALVMCLSTQAITTLFGNSYSSAPLFLALLTITYLFSSTGTLSTANILNSQGQTMLNLKFMLLTAAIGFPMGYLLIMYYGVFGLIFTTLLAPVPSTILTLVWLKKHYDLSVDWVSSAKIVTSSMVTAALTYLFVSFTGFAMVLELFLGALFFVAVLIAAMLFTKTLSLSDLNSLRAMTSGLGPIGKIVGFILNVYEKFMF